MMQQDQQEQVFCSHRQQNQFIDCKQSTILPDTIQSHVQTSIAAASTANVNYYATQIGECNQTNHNHHDCQHIDSGWQQNNCATQSICPNEYVELSVESNVNQQWIFDSSRSKQIIFSQSKEPTISFEHKQNSTIANRTNNETFNHNSGHDYSNNNLQLTPPEKIIQRVKANKKERRRTQSINQAFNELRKHIPDVPSDTKLSKIKTLRLAISYISHLMSTLNGDQEQSQSNMVTGVNSASRSTFRANNELKSSHNTSEQPSNSNISFVESNTDRNLITTKSEKSNGKHKKHRTGWPEIIWKSTNSLRKMEIIQRVEL